MTANQETPGVLSGECADHGLAYVQATLGVST